MSDDHLAAFAQGAGRAAAQRSSPGLFELGGRHPRYGDDLPSNLHSGFSTGLTEVGLETADAPAEGSDSGS